MLMSHAPHASPADVLMNVISLDCLYLRPTFSSFLLISPLYS